MKEIISVLEIGKTFHRYFLKNLYFITGYGLDNLITYEKELDS